MLFQLWFVCRRDMCARCKHRDCVIRGETTAAGASCEGLVLREARRFLSDEFREAHPLRGRVLPPSWPFASPCLHVRRQTASKMSNFRRRRPFNAHLQISLPIIALSRFQSRWFSLFCRHTAAFSGLPARFRSSLSPFNTRLQMPLPITDFFFFCDLIALVLAVW